MRCRICLYPQKNTAQKDLWNEHSVCRTCGILLEHFSWNSNFLHEYWNQSSHQITQKNNVRYQDIIYYKWNPDKTVSANDNVRIDFLRAMKEVESIDWNFVSNHIGFENKRSKECIQFVRLDKNKWYAESLIGYGRNWSGYVWYSECDNQHISQLLRLFFEEVPWFATIKWRMKKVS